MDSRIGTCLRSSKGEALRVKENNPGGHFVTGPAAIRAAESGSRLWNWTENGWEAISLVEAKRMRQKHSLGALRRR